MSARVRVEKFLVQLECSESDEGGQVPTAWLDREAFTRLLLFAARILAQQQTTGPVPDVRVTEEN